MNDLGPWFFVVVTTTFYGLCLFEGAQQIRWLIVDRKERGGR